MKKVGIFYGSSTGTTEQIAKKIAAELGLPNADVYDAAVAKEAQIAPCEVLLLGSSTWGLGELQDDFYDLLETLKSMDLTGKQVAIFGCGDENTYDSTFCDSMGIIYEELQSKGVQFIGFTSTDGFFATNSKAVVDGQFVGLAVDDSSSEQKTDERIRQWTSELKTHL